MPDGRMAADLTFTSVRLAGKPVDSLWDLHCDGSHVSSVREHLGGGSDGRLVTPSLCHPHIHLDKCFLLQHPKYSSLKIRKGDFLEALEMTNQAKSRFERDDLLERGRALIEESISFGVTHMRAFVEVDTTVDMKCLEAGLELKEEFKGKCYIQICAFAQDPITSQPDSGIAMMKLMTLAATRPGVDVIGSTPYVEKTPEAQKHNILWMIFMASVHRKHLDFHLDYNLDPHIDPSVYTVIEVLKLQGWPDEQAVTLGHCTRLTLLSDGEWQKLREDIGALPISFVGLPTSDIFMMGRPQQGQSRGQTVRGTLHIPQMIKGFGLQGALGINNVNNAFTPYGSCDPLSIAAMGVGIYQAGTKEESEILFECVSSRARCAIGLGTGEDLEIRVGDVAHLVAFGVQGPHMTGGFRNRREVTDLVYNACRERVTVFNGVVVSA